MDRRGDHHSGNVRHGRSHVCGVDCRSRCCRAARSPDTRVQRWGPPAVLFASAQQQPELPHLAKSIVRTVQFGPAEPFFPSLCCIYRGDEQSQRRALWPLGKKQWNMTHITNNAIPKLRKAPQPPLSYPGATPDSDRAKKPPLAEPAATDQELNPGDRVEGLGDFGKPTGEFGTVEQANEDDAVVKWDNDGRTRLHQPWLKKV